MQSDALWFALGANKTQGQRLSPADKKHAILLALKAWPDKSGPRPEDGRRDHRPPPAFPRGVFLRVSASPFQSRNEPEGDR